MTSSATVSNSSACGFSIINKSHDIRSNREEEYYEGHSNFLHSVIDLWPQLLQKDEFMAIFHSRPLGIRVIGDCDGRNAMVVRVTGSHAEQSGVKVGCVIYCIDGKVVLRKKHRWIVETLKTCPLPIKIIFILPNEFNQP